MSLTYVLLAVTFSYLLGMAIGALISTEETITDQELQNLVNKLERKMKSGNSVPVKNVLLQTVELRTILDALYSFGVADKQEINHE